MKTLLTRVCADGQSLKAFEVDFALTCVGKWACHAHPWRAPYNVLSNAMESVGTILVGHHTRG